MRLIGTCISEVRSLLKRSITCNYVVSLGIFTFVIIRTHQYSPKMVSRAEPPRFLCLS